MRVFEMRACYRKLEKAIFRCTRACATLSEHTGPASRSLSKRPRPGLGLAVTSSIIATACAANVFERSGRLPPDHNVAAGVIAAVRFTRAFAVTSSVMLDYRRLFAKFSDYSSDEYKAARSQIHEKCAQRILNLCKTQGAVYVKIGQHVASMSHAVPKEYTLVLKQLEDRAAFKPYSDIRRVLCSELGGNVEDHFADFEKVPVAAASLAQVHRARIPASGDQVAVKIQYPGLEALVAGDLASIKALSRLLHFVFPYLSLDWMVREFKVNLAQELDFLLEAESAERTAAFFAGDKYISVPRIYRDLSTKKVLTMEYIDGIRVDNVNALVDAGIRPVDVAQQVVDAFGRMIFVSGFVHCDGHSGNMLVKPRVGCKGEFQLFLLDHGLYRELDDEFRKTYCRLWRGLVLRRGKEVERACADLGAPGFSNIFSIFLLNRSWTSAQRLDVDLRNKMSKEELKTLMKEFRSGGLENGADVLEYLKDLPQDLLLVFKMNSLVRNVNKALGAQVDRFRANARHAVHGLYHQNHSRPTSEGSYSGSQVRVMSGLRAGKSAEREPWMSGLVWHWLTGRIFNPVAEFVDIITVEINLAILDFVRFVVIWWKGLGPLIAPSSVDAIG